MNNEQTLLDTMQSYLYKADTNTNKNVTRVGSDSKRLHEAEYRQARVEKLKELYEQCVPEVEHKWILPKGVTDGRKAIKIEFIVGEDISPFDLPDFKDQMPSLIDYIKEG